MSNNTPLAVLDLIPRSSGDSVAAAVGNAIDLARQAERLGYQRYWLAEHHLNPGVLGASPAVSIALIAGATGTIRVGSAGVQLGHRQPLATVEEAVSADVVVGDTDSDAARLASGYGLWVRSIRKGSGAIAFPTPEEADKHEWTVQDRDLVRDRTDTQLVGSPRTVADKLEQLRDATGAHELAVTTITHDHADRVRSYELLAEEWNNR